MIIKYTNAMDDLVALNRYHCKHSRAVKTIKLACVIPVAIFVFMVSLFVDAGPDVSRLSIVGGGAVFVVLFYLFVNYVYYFTLGWQARRMYGEGATEGVLGQHELEIDEHGLVERTEVSEARHRWQGVERIAETDEHAFIYISALMAHVIPKRSVTVGDPDQFIAAARQQILTAANRK